MSREARAGAGAKPKILIIDDDADLRLALSGCLEGAGMEAVEASGGEQALRLFDDSFSAVLVDLHMPGLDGMDTLARIKQKEPDIECIMVTGEKDTRAAVAAMKTGAFDYVLKPPDPDELIAIVRQAIRACGLTRENSRLRAALGATRRQFEWIGVSPASEDLLSKVAQVARSDSPVLITGETGTGKSILARMIHNLGPRQVEPFVTVSCAAIPGELVESELFGHEKGAFTGAMRERPGRMELVEKGTLFLDEIGEVPLIVQPKILRVLQEREFERVGGTRTLRMEARVIAATNCDLPAMCARHEFREDLFYRLNVLHLHVPPLRERREDIELFTEANLARLGGAMNRPVKLSKDALQALRMYDWPGNVRELQNVLERAVTFAGSDTIAVADLMLGGVRAAFESSGSQTGSLAGMTMDEIEKKAIEDTLAACGGNKAEAARRLDVSEKTIYNRVKRLGMAVPD